MGNGLRQGTQSKSQCQALSGKAGLKAGPEALSGWGMSVKGASGRPGGLRHCRQGPPTFGVFILDGGVGAL